VHYRGSSARKEGGGVGVHPLDVAAGPGCSLPKVSGYLPFTKKAADAMADVMAKDPRRKVAVDQLQFSRGQSPIQTLPRAVDIYYDAMVQVMNLKADPKVSMPQIQKQIQQIIVEEGLKK